MHAQQFADDGFLVVEGAIPFEDCADLACQSRPALDRAVGSRNLLAEPWCAALSRTIRRHFVLFQLIPEDFVAAQCTYFEKSTAQNWLVPVHQDLSIPAAERVAEATLTGWSVKEGALYVQAPQPILAQLVAVRLHLDACQGEDGPLRVVPGSHKLGVTSPEAAAAARKAGPEIACLMRQGAALVMKPLLLHSSSKATGTSKRRVLHLLFGPPTLPFGLRWPFAV